MTSQRATLTSGPRLAKPVTLTRRGEIDAVRRQGRSVACALFVVFYLPRATSPARIVLSLSRRLGGAVVRNRIRRQIKEIMRLLLPRLAAPIDMMIIARAPAVKADFQRKAAALEGLLSRRRLLAGAPSSQAQNPSDHRTHGHKDGRTSERHTGGCEDGCEDGRDTDGRAADETRRSRPAGVAVEPAGRTGEA